jgi:hypothetical protein
MWRKFLDSAIGDFFLTMSILSFLLGIDMIAKN